MKPSRSVRDPLLSTDLSLKVKTDGPYAEVFRVFASYFTLSPSKKRETLRLIQTWVNEEKKKYPVTRGEKA